MHDKYVKILQKYINEQQLNLTVKSLTFRTGTSNRFVAVSFKEKSEKSKIGLSTSAMICYAGSVTLIAGERHDNYLEEENRKMRKISMFLANMFWIWLSYFDVYLTRDLAKYGERILLLTANAFDERRSINPDENINITFKDAIDNFNEERLDGIFGKNVSDKIEYGNFDFDNYEYVEPDNNMFH